MAENMVNCLINALSAVIAVEYMEHGFKKRYKGTRRWLLFAAGSASYFLVVSVLNHYIVFEGILGLCYAAVLASRSSQMPCCSRSACCTRASCR